MQFKNHDIIAEHIAYNYNHIAAPADLERYVVQRGRTIIKEFDLSMQGAGPHARARLAWL